MLQGDVNADMRTTWFKHTLGPKGPWSFLSPPYRARTPTNTVRNHRRISHKVTNWLLLSDTTPCDKCEWTIMPRLSTHYALLFSLHYSTSVLRPADLAHKQFQFAATTKEQMDKAAAVVSLGVYWCLYGDWTPNGTIKLYWELIKHAVRGKSDVTTISSDAQEVLAITTSANEEDKERVKAWWTRKQDAAMAASIGVNMHRLKGTNITSQTARVFRISSQKFSIIDKVNVDGRLLPTDPEKFGQELQTQAQEMYSNGPGTLMDAPYIRRGADKYNSAPHLQDTPDFISQMWRLTSERKHQPTEDAAGKLPTFQEFEASVHGRWSETTSVDELPRSILKRLDGHVWMVLMLILHMIFAGI